MNIFKLLFNFLFIIQDNFYIVIHNLNNKYLLIIIYYFYLQKYQQIIFISNYLYFSYAFKNK